MALLGAPSLLAACGSDDAARAGGGAPIRIGYVTPTTGRLAAYAAADDFTVATVRELVEDGFETTHGTFTVEFLVADSASDPDRAAAAAGDLMDAGVALVLVAATADTVNPVSDACEGRGVPCLSTMVPWQTWFFGRNGNPNAPFRSTFHFFWGIEDLAVTYLDMWDAVRTDRTVGVLRPSAGPGFAAAVRRAGYRFVDPGDAQIVTTEAWWTPDVPFISSLKGVGPVSWRLGPVANVARTPLAGGQWRRRGDGWDLELVSNKAAPDIPTTSTMERIG